ncbi:MAG: hypothetical protein ACK5AY_06515 [Bacteroidota bacterium]
MLKHTEIEKEKPILLFAIDNSESMLLNKDSSWIKNELLNNVNQLAEEVSEKFDVRIYNFSNKVLQGYPEKFNGKETDFTGLFKETYNNYSNRNLGAMLICSDGIYNKGINPVYSQKENKFPVFTIAIGDTTEMLDLSIKKINNNPISYLGNQFPAEIIIQSKKLKGFKGAVSVSKDGKILEQRPIDVTSNSWVQSFNFLFNADKPGISKYNVVVTSSPEEKNKFNNASSFIVEVVDSREKILILAATPHPDIAALKSAIESNANYDVEVFMANEFSGSVKTYGMVICHMLSWNNTSSIKNELENKSVPYLLISSNSNDLFPGLKINGPTDKFNETDPIINSSFSLFNISPELKNYINNFPPLKSPFGNYNLSPDVNSLFYQKIGSVETETPLLYFSANAVNKTGVILGDGIWRWKFRDFADHENFNLFNELVNKCVQYLIVKEDKSFFRVYTKKIFNENDEISFDAEVYNKSYELITDPDVTATIIDKSGKKYDYNFSRNQKTYRLGGIFFPPGDYSYEVRTKVDAVLYTKKGTFTVNELIAEKINQVANHQMLYNLSKQTGGKMFYKEQFSKIIKELMENDQFKTISFEQKKLTDIIDLKWLFIIILVLLSAEWFVRKRNGLY